MLSIPAPRSSGFTHSTPVPLYWARYGEPGAPVLLVLHGGPGASHDYLLPQLLELASFGYALVFYDQRGGGRSKTDDRAPITAQTHISDLASVCAELELGGPDLVGYSWGGLLALLYALHERSLAPTRLTLLDPAPATHAFRAEFEAEFARRQQGPEIAAMRADLASSGLRERDPAAYKQRAFELSVAGYFADPRRAQSLTPFRVIGRVQQSVWESMGDYDLLADGRLRQIGVPSFVAHGKQDPIPLASSTGIAEQLGATLVALDDCGHVPYVEQPAALFAAIGRFLADTTSSVIVPSR